MPKTDLDTTRLLAKIAALEQLVEEYEQSVYEQTEKLQAKEQALRQNEEWFRTLTENASDIITVLNTDGTILYESPSARRITGHAPSDLLGKPVLNFIHPDDAQKTSDAVAQAFQIPGTRQSAEVRFRTSGGQWITLEAIGQAVLGTSGQMVLVINSRDITERKKMEALAGEIERLTTQGQLMDGISHEMKNPLFILTGRLQLMRDKLTHQEYSALLDDLQKIESAVMRMVSIADRFGKLVKPPSSSLEPTAVQAVLQQVLELLTGDLTKNRIAVITSLAPDLPAIQANPQQLQVAFTNLIINAMQAMAAAHGKGTLTVTAALQDGWIEIRIQDDGPGIAPEHRARLFEPFFTTKPAGQGTGMSLWAVRSTAMALRGTVACETDTGKGATFIMRLPVEKTGHQA